MGFLSRLNRNDRYMVRAHLIDVEPSIEGILVGCFNNHYVLLAPKVLEAEDQTQALPGHVEIPRERVMFLQVLGEGLK